MTIRTVKTLSELPGAYERGRDELVRILSARHGVRFVVVEDEREPVDGPLAAHEPSDEHSPAVACSHRPVV